MERRNRREILAMGGGTLLASLAGCTSDDETGGSGETSDSNDDGEIDPSDETNTDDTTDLDGSADSSDDSADDPVPTTQTQTLIEDTRTVQEDGWYYWEFFLNREADTNLRTTVRSGPAIDIIVTTQDEFEEYQNQNRFRYNGDLSQLDTVGETTETTLPARDDYVLLLDNTSAGEASPPSFGEDSARVDVELTASG